MNPYVLTEFLREKKVSKNQQFCSFLYYTAIP